VRKEKKALNNGVATVNRNPPVNINLSIFTKEQIMSGLLGMLGGAGGAGGLGGIMGMMGGPLGAIVGPMLEKIVSQVLQGVIEEVAKELKLPDSVKDAAQAAVAGALGDKEGVQKNLKELLSDFQKETNASDSDMGNVDRDAQEFKDLSKKLFNQANLDNMESEDMKKKKKGGGQGAGGAQGAGAAGGADAAGGAGAAGGAAAGGSNATDGASSETKFDWFETLALVLAKAGGKQAQKVEKLSKEVSSANDALDKHEASTGKTAGGEKDDTTGAKLARDQQQKMTELQAASAKMGFLMTMINATLNSLADGLKTAAQVK
jgi:hypothetical protein